MKSVPKVQKYMTTTPQAINSESPIEEAMEVMKKNGIRHLPVVKGGKLFGLISESDIRRVLNFAAINPKTTKVAEVCEDQPYETKPDAQIDEVAAEMAEKKMGSALVVDNGNLVGIFTTTDALKALADVCNQRFHK